MHLLVRPDTNREACRIDDTLTVRDGERVLSPEGHRPVIAAHRDKVYYLNVLTRAAHSMAASDDPDYVRNTRACKAPESRWCR